MYRSAELVRQARTFLVACALLLPSAAAQAQLLPLPTLATTDKGVLVGQATQGVRQFLGVPYAAPPTGSRRWKAPAAESAYLLRDASRFAPHCPQVATPFGAASTNEDCLYLNVFAPPSIDVLLGQVPVFVWLHPGSLQSGESDDYIPTALVKRGFVVVTVNYRLGALGWMAHPALSAESSGRGSGNYGLMDQQAALRWVQRNIRAFGGDPRNVTIFGSDAGAVSVYAHIASPGSAGLFHRAIAQSGSYFYNDRENTLAEAEAAGQSFATAVGCPQQDLSCLRARPVSTLLANQSPGRSEYLPNADGALLPNGVYPAIKSGSVNAVPVITGVTRDEFRLYVALLELQGLPTNEDTYRDRIMETLGFNSGTADLMVNLIYPASNYGGSEALALGALGTERVFACGQYTLTHHLAKSMPVWMYELNDPNAPQELLPPVSFPYGAYHGAEIPYLLDAPDGAATFSADSQQLANTMKSYWTQFARTGDPNGGTAPAWPQYHDTSFGQEGADNIFLSLDAPTPQPINSPEYLLRHACLFWSPPYGSGD